MSEEFIQTVVKWIKLDDKVKELTTQIRELREEKKQYEEYILTSMKSTNQDVLNMSSGGTLRASVSKTKGPLKQDYIRQVLTEFTKDQEKATIITESLMNNRPLTERSYLKRSAPRKHGEKK